MAKAEIFRFRRPGVEVTPVTKNIGEEPIPLLESLPSITAYVEEVQMKGRFRKYTVENLIISYPWREVLILNEGLIVDSSKSDDKDIRVIKIPLGRRRQLYHVRQFASSLSPEFTIRLTAKEKPANQKRSKKNAKEGYLNTESTNPEMPPAEINRSTS